MQAGLHDWLAENSNFQDTIRILEIGFGTGLNALLTLQSAFQRKLSIYYQTLETYPLAYEQIKPLQYVEQIDSPFRVLF